MTTQFRMCRPPASLPTSEGLLRTLAQAVTPKEIAKSKLRSLPAQNKTFVCADVHVGGPAICCKHAEVAWPGGGDGNGDAARRRRRREKTSGSVGRGECGMGCGGGGMRGRLWPAFRELRASLWPILPREVVRLYE